MTEPRKINYAPIMWGIGALVSIAVAWGDIRTEMKRNREYNEIILERMIDMGERVSQLELNEAYNKGKRDGTTP